MSGFREDWLDLRESADFLSRDRSLLQRALGFADDGEATTITDIGSGTGSTLRALAPGLVRPLHWRLVDHDPHLLGIAKNRHDREISLECVEADLNDLAAIPLAGTRLMTASALFDLCSRAMIEALAFVLRPREIGLYAALNYDGMILFETPHALDGAAVAAFNAHQRGDKGIGPAAGPEAAHILREVFEAQGYLVETAKSDWALTPEHVALQNAFIEGMARAVAETGMIDAEKIAAWKDFRLLQTDRSGLRVGHLDMLGLPPDQATF
ncbi:class I SAM-dependent methyltransferase [Limoniibacter endophyticus]|uniref:Trans-aconitate methyltransferase n=1 Tax=Limoniibacter endophyticus TaxID=1565040 RepID=A0A8J3DLY4_9HYPH|nr:class I SAM-dependent methyltransferase [Limoniibacter endophyticus]GHC69111.1 trans-aconitate methyltransferase [Limoniibacter endophyticus]